MRHFGMPPGYDRYKLATPPEYEFLGPDPAEEEEIPEPVIDEEWNASRGEYETVVTFASGTKFAVRQNSDDNWEVHGLRGACCCGAASCETPLFMDFTTREHALSWLTDIEHWGW